MGILVGEQWTPTLVMLLRHAPYTDIGVLVGSGKVVGLLSGFFIMSESPIAGVPTQC